MVGPPGGGAPFAFSPKPPAPWRDKLANDPMEHDLLAAIRATPADEGARMVYADWLEQRGRADEASFVRQAGAHAEAGSVEWRRIEDFRSCPKCQPIPRYVATAEDVQHAGGHGGCPIVIDPAADANELIESYKLWAKRSEIKGAGRLPPVG